MATLTIRNLNELEVVLAKLPYVAAVHFTALDWNMFESKHSDQFSLVNYFAWSDCYQQLYRKGKLVWTNSVDLCAECPYPMDVAIQDYLDGSEF